MSNLFILEAKFLSRMLNNLHDHHLYHSLHLEKKGPQINHMSFTDDVVILSSTKDTILQLIMGFLNDYKNVFVQLINEEKIHFMIPSKTPCDTIDIIKVIIGFIKEDNSITYLGFPLSMGVKELYASLR